MELSVKQIADLLGGKVQGDGSIKIKKLDTLQDASKGSISFLSNPKYENQIYQTQASAVICNMDFSPKNTLKTTLIKVEDAYLSFSSLLEEINRQNSLQKVGIEEPSYIGENTSTGDKVYRGAFSYIGNSVKIGENVKIYPQAYIGDNSTIGNNTIIHSGVKVYPKTKIGNNCIIHSGAIVGSDGFGFAPQSDGSYKPIPQMGNVIIEDNVSIGSNTVIDCATLNSTIIRDGVKLDNLIQVAHNVEIGKNTVIAAQSGISGSTKIGEHCVIAGQVGVIGHLQIADKVIIGAQAGIGKSIDQKGTIILGSPGFERNQYLRSYTVFKRLPDIENRIKELEEKSLNLPTTGD